jgi:hypothetical protein
MACNRDNFSFILLAAKSTVKHISLSEYRNVKTIDMQWSDVANEASKRVCPFSIVVPQTLDRVYIFEKETDWKQKENVPLLYESFFSPDPFPLRMEEQVALAIRRGVGMAERDAASPISGPAKKSETCSYSPVLRLQSAFLRDVRSSRGVAKD